MQFTVTLFLIASYVNNVCFAADMVPLMDKEAHAAVTRGLVQTGASLSDNSRILDEVMNGHLSSVYNDDYALHIEQIETHIRNLEEALTEAREAESRTVSLARRDLGLDEYLSALVEARVAIRQVEIDLFYLRERLRRWMDVRVHLDFHVPRIEDRNEESVQLDEDASDLY